MQEVESLKNGYRDEIKVENLPRKSAASVSNKQDHKVLHETSDMNGFNY